MHNNIMAAGSRDRPPMLATGRYAQWRSRFLRYIDTRPNGDALRKCILKGPYTPTIVTTPAVPATEDSPAVPEQTTVETVMNMTPENRAHFESEKEAIHLILTGIGDEIYSTVDACQTAQEMWEAIERLQQGESLNIQDVKTNLFWEFGQFTSHDGETIESYYTRFYKMMNEMIRNNLTVATMQVNVQFLQQLQPEWSRFVTIVKQQHKLDEVSYHKLFDILKQYQKEVNELRAERMAKNANPLALVATAQTLQDPYYQSSKSHKSYAPTSKASLPGVGSRDRPPMLAIGRYAQWQPHFLRYIDTRPNGDALRKCILEGPYILYTLIIPVVPAIKNSPAVSERTTVKTILNMSPENKAHFESEKEAIHLLLTGIGDEIYSTVDACKTAHEMWEAIERLQQEWSRFVTIVKQQHKLDEVSYHKLFNILKQYQKEVNEIRVERIAKNANPLALVATAQPHQDPYYQTSKSHKSYAPTSKTSLLTRSHATTRHKGKEIAKPITPPSESAFEEDNDPEQAQKDKEMQKNLALVLKYFKNIYKPTNNNLKTFSNTRNKNVDTTPRYKIDNQAGQFRNQRTMTVTGARETVGGQLSDWLADTDEETDEQELEVHYNYMAKIQEVPTADSGTDSEPLEQVQYDAGYNVFANEIQHSEQPESISNICVVETGDSNVIPDSPDMCDNDIHNDQNVVESDDERVALANLIANLKLDVDENKKI
ncbi:hypothetical protein Tco_1097914 [Tanacetum coccineum]